MRTFFIEHKENHPLYYRIEHFVFQIDFEFYLIVYPSYYNGFDSFELKNSFIEQVITNKKSTTLTYERGYELKQIKKDIIEGKVFKGKINEVVSIYGIAKKYCYYRQIPYIDWINNILNYSIRFQEAITTIESSTELFNKTSVLNSLNELYKSNNSELKWATTYEQIKITELMSKSFIKQLKTK